MENSLVLALHSVLSDTIVVSQKIKFLGVTIMVFHNVLTCMSLVITAQPASGSQMKVANSVACRDEGGTAQRVFLFTQRPLAEFK